MEEKPVLNQHNKAEYPPMHTAEHILNGTMVKMFGCGRAVSAHVERTKSKLDYDFPRALTAEEVAAVEARVNEVIAADMPVTFSFVTQQEAADRFDLKRLPDGASDVVRGERGRIRPLLVRWRPCEAHCRNRCFPHQ